MRRRLGSLLVAVLIAFSVGVTTAEARPVRTPHEPGRSEAQFLLQPRSRWGVSDDHGHRVHGRHQCDVR